MRYLDASALVKRYVTERDSPRVRQWLTAGPVATSRLSAVEIGSALGRRCREGAFSAAERDRILGALEDDFTFVRVIELSAPVVGEAQVLLRRHPLRAGDAIQLASAVWLRRELDQVVSFAVYDDRLKAAAAAEGLPVFP
ncbi:MAG: type II toxin-antitoxin system VapC family toxin [Vicinamibacteria bacterium]